MSFAMLEAQIKNLPEDCLDEVSAYIDYLLYRRNREKKESENHLEKYFGCMGNLEDGLEMQRSMRREWG